MEWHIYTDCINKILETKSEIISEPKNIKLLREEFLSYPERTKFYSERDNIKNFNERFEDFISDCPIKIPDLCFYDKFRIYKLVHPDYVVWSIPISIKGLEGDIQPEKGGVEELVGYCKYSISTDGEIWSHGLTSQGEKLRTPAVNKQGYIRGLFGKNISHLVHRLVLTTFTTDMDYKGFNKHTLTSNHINTIRDDNRLLNLEWMTHMENIMDMTLNDRCEHSSQPIRGTTTIDLGIPIGSVFYLRRRSDIREYGISLKTFGTQLLQNPIMFSCKWEDCSIEEIEEDKLSIPDEVQKWIEYRKETNGFPLSITLLGDMFGYNEGENFYLTESQILRDFTFTKKLGKNLHVGVEYKGCFWKYDPSVVNKEVNEEETMKLLDNIFGGKLESASVRDIHGRKLFR